MAPRRRIAALGELAALTVSLLLGSWGAAAEAPLKSGIAIDNLDTSVRPQDDFFAYANGGWLARTEIPSDRASYGASDLVDDAVQQQLRAVIEDLAQGETGGESRQIADLYASFMDEATLDTLGVNPLAGNLRRIDSLRTPAEVAAEFARLSRIGVAAPLMPQVHQDARDSSRYVFDLEQDGLGLPDRDYYLGGAPELARTLNRYGRHIEAMLALAGEANARHDARAIVALETALARIQWTKVDLRDPVKAYNKYPTSQLRTLAPGIDWEAYLAAAGAAGRLDTVVIGQPTYVTRLARLLASTPMPAWRAYLRWRVVSDHSPYLSRPLAAEHFAFYGTALRGIARDRERWRRGVELVDASVGEALGRRYVERYFPPASKVRVERLVEHLLAAYGADIRSLDWMSPATRERAEAKLAKLTVKIGYPSSWRDYAALAIERTDLVGNVRRAREFEYERNLRKLGGPIDRVEWSMTPPTINAYYNPEQNEIVFPAGILQPPFFDPAADDAVNYGSIGQTIGHEISHAFDDWGSQYDGDGNLLDPPGWFTAVDLERFRAKSRALVAQYAAYAPVPGYPINGELTLGENIADNAGLAVAYRAYLLSLDGREPAVIDGFTGAQRFFLGYAQSYLGKTRDREAILAIESDPHSPDRFRGMLPEMNLAAFHEAFGTRPGDRMYRPPAERITLW